MMMLNTFLLRMQNVTCKSIRPVSVHSQLQVLTMKSNKYWCYVLAIGLANLVLYSYFTSEFSFIPKSLRSFWLPNLKVTKTILLWNSPGRIETASFGLGSRVFVENGCEVTACEIYDNRSAMPFEQYDAVVMNIHEIYMTRRPEITGFQRTQRQRFIFLSQESPQTIPYLNPAQYANYFNWTMTYKLNSDIQLLYGRIDQLPAAPVSAQQVDYFIKNTHRLTENMAANKTRNVVWMVSHCNTAGKRETYLQELQRHIDVDVYGGCGNFSCQRNGTHWLSEPHCYDLLAEKYKFYLSFENSVCQDYATEKLFHILAHNLVPVVYGGANYSAIAPPHSYIDALHFKPAELAAYLERLSANDTLYNEFFWWKKFYTVQAGVEQMARHAFCDLCKKLHADDSIKVYDEIESQWGVQSQCIQMSSWLER